MDKELPGPVKRLQKLAPDQALNLARGPVLQALAASRPTGLMLVLEPGSGVDLAWLVAGLQSGAKLLAAGPDAGAMNFLKPALDVDLRVAFHIQEIAGFLQDISHHRFDLVYCGCPLTGDSTSLLENMLVTGGILIVDQVENPDMCQVDPETASLLPLESAVEPGNTSIYIKGEPALKRRGGRAARARPSLRSL